MPAIEKSNSASTFCALSALMLVNCELQKLSKKHDFIRICAQINDSRISLSENSTPKLLRV